MASYPTTSTAEMPMPGGRTQLRLIKAFESNDSLYELCQELPRLAKEMRDDPGFVRVRIGMSKTCEDIEKDHLTGWDMVILLHSMSREAIKAIIYGTLARDSMSTHRWYDKPASIQRGAGVYVIGLARDGRNGKFLNERELEKLVKGLTRYVNGWKILNSDPPMNSLTQSQREDKAWVKTVDNACQEQGQQSDGSSARFMPRATDDVIVTELIEAFIRRITHLDPMKQTRHIQSPLYVGCSVDLRERLAEYSPSRGFRRVNRPLGLTISVLEASGIKVEIVPRIVLRTWKPEQLALGERLITTLAGSMVCQGGFNATQAGANTGAQMTATVTQATMKNGWASVERSGYLSTNISSTIDGMVQREQFLDSLTELNWELQKLEFNADQAEELQKEVRVKNKDVGNILESYSRYLDLLREKRDKIRELEEYSKILKEIINKL